MSAGTFDGPALRRTFSRYATGVAVVTARTPAGELLGVTANSFVSVSLEPPLVLWSLHRSARSLAGFRSALRYGFNVLAEHQTWLAQRFARQSPDKFVGVAYDEDAAGAIRLPECVAFVGCVHREVIPGGDHVLLIGEVSHVDVAEGRPLVFWSGQFRAIAEAAPPVAEQADGTARRAGRVTGSKPIASFDAAYARSDDPWGTLDSPYEIEKLAESLAQLGSRRYRRALEVGCGVGAMTEQLARRSECLDAVDGSLAAVTRTARRCAELPAVSVYQMVVPAAIPPPRTYDLIVFSEIGYYLDADDLARTVSGLADALVPGGDLLAVHWTHPHPDHRSTSDEVSGALAADARLTAMRSLVSTRYGNTYRVDVLRRSTS